MQRSRTPTWIRVAFIAAPVVLALGLFFGIQALGNSARAFGGFGQATSTPTAVAPAAVTPAAAATAAKAAATAAAPATSVATPAAGLPTTGTGGLLSQHSQSTGIIPWLPFIGLLLLAGGFVSYKVMRQR